MSEKVQISTTIDPTLKATLEDMAAESRRTLRGQIEWLIIREAERRQRPRATEAQTVKYFVPLHGLCPVCGEFTTFNYLGEQENGKGDSVPMYACEKCGTSLTALEEG